MRELRYALRGLRRTPVFGASVVALLALVIPNGIEAWDVSSFAVAAGFLLAVAFVASYLPARRAARVPPVDALRMN